MTALKIVKFSTSMTSGVMGVIGMAITLADGTKMVSHYDVISNTWNAFETVKTVTQTQTQNE